jgi:ribosomal protein S6
MKLYELVAIIDPQLSQDDQQSLIAQIESMLPEGATIEQKDEIGLQKVYQFAATKAGVAYFVSWYISMQSSDIIPLKRKMTLLKWVLRHVVYTVDKHNPMVNFKEINALYLKRLEEIDKKGKKVKLAV